MRITLLVATRGDRPQFVEHLMRNIIPSQTRQPDEVILVNRPPHSDENDQRNRIIEGILSATGDLILFIEDDDYYRSDYVENMEREWNGEDLIGFDSTLYYHIVYGRWRHMKHYHRSSLFCTGIKREVAERFPFTNKHIDIDLWRTLRGKLMSFDGSAIGIKHGVGMTGGIGHNESFCKTPDPDGMLLRNWVNEVSFDFYCTFKK